MNCTQIEEIISMYIEDDLPDDMYNEVSSHLETCDSCRALKEKVEELVCFFPELEEEVPFYLKNRLYYIPESQEIDPVKESRFYFMRWVAASIGTIALFLNLLYFTDLYPPANRVLHSVTSEIKVFTVQAGAFIQKIAEGKGMFLFSLFKKEEDKNKEKYQGIKKRNESVSNREPGLDQPPVSTDQLNKPDTKTDTNPVTKQKSKLETKPKGGNYDGK